MLPPPPQRTAQAIFTANGSSTAKAPSADTGLTRLHKTFADIISLVHPIAETRALNCNTAVSSKLPYIEPQIRACDSRTTRKSALFRAGAKFEPLSAPLQSGIRFFRVLLPASPTASLAGRLPRIRCSEPLAENRAYHVPILADPTVPGSIRLASVYSPAALTTTCSF